MTREEHAPTRDQQDLYMGVTQVIWRAHAAGLSWAEIGAPLREALFVVDTLIGRDEAAARRSATPPKGR